MTAERRDLLISYDTGCLRFTGKLGKVEAPGPSTSTVAR